MAAKKNQGYGYASGFDVSVEGLDANAACRTVVAIAQDPGIALDIGFMWRPQEAAVPPVKERDCRSRQNSESRDRIRAA